MTLFDNGLCRHPYNPNAVYDYRLDFAQGETHSPFFRSLCCGDEAADENKDPDTVATGGSRTATQGSALVVSAAVVLVWWMMFL
jgi:hypothetical protein